MKQNDSNRIMIGVRGGGCNGLQYYIEPFKGTLDKNDEIIKIDNENEIIICGKSVLFLIGTEIKWKTDFLGTGLEFINPNANSTCGCGETFNVD
jgi:iron-sulfur cluster assembly protein